LRERFWVPFSAHAFLSTSLSLTSHELVCVKRRQPPRRHLGKEKRVVFSSDPPSFLSVCLLSPQPVPGGREFLLPPSLLRNLCDFFSRFISLINPLPFFKNLLRSTGPYIVSPSSLRIRGGAILSSILYRVFSTPSFLAPRPVIRWGVLCLFPLDMLPSPDGRFLSVLDSIIEEISRARSSPRLPLLFIGIPSFRFFFFY